MKVNEIFLSIQGESTHIGLPTIFVRFQGCNLRCAYCDTAYAYTEGFEMTNEEIFEEIKKFFYKRVCITGGEPMLNDDIDKLLKLLEDYDVTVETNGSILLNKIKLTKNHHYIMDMKTPLSGTSDKMFMENFDYLDENDEIKFVIGDRNDFEWSKKIISEYHKKGLISFSPMFGKIEPSKIAKWILDEKLDVRFQIQIQKYIWDPKKRGV